MCHAFRPRRHQGSSNVFIIMLIARCSSSLNGVIKLCLSGGIMLVSAGVCQLMLRLSTVTRARRIMAGHGAYPCQRKTFTPTRGHEEQLNKARDSRSSKGFEVVKKKKKSSIEDNIIAVLDYMMIYCKYCCKWHAC